MSDPLMTQARRRGASVTADWRFRQAQIDGVVIKEVRSVLGGGGALTELWRRDWGLDQGGIEQVFAKRMAPRVVSGWHVHLKTTDRLFALVGQIRVVLFDGRPDSPSYRRIAEYVYGEQRSALVVVLPGVWHAVRNESARDDAVLVNLVDLAYGYDAPDHLHLPHDHPDIPYRFAPLAADSS